MSYRDVYVAEETMEKRAQENVDAAEHRRLVNELKGSPQPWVIRLACWLGCRLAARLIAAGKALERASLRPSRTLESS